MCVLEDPPPLDRFDASARITLPSADRRHWLGGTLSIVLHAAGFALAVSALPAPTGLPPGGEEAIEVELITAEALDSLHAASGAGARVEVPLPDDIPPPTIVPEAHEILVHLPPDVSPPDITSNPPPPVEAVPETIASLDITVPLPPEPAMPDPLPAPAADARDTEIERVERTAPAPSIHSLSKEPSPPRAAAPDRAPARATSTTRTPARSRPEPVVRRGAGTIGKGREAVNSTAAIRGGATGGSDTSAGRAAFASFQSRVLAHLARHKRFPEAARLQVLRGRVAVTFSLDAGGRVTSITLAGSSGHPLLDAEALAMVRRASPFPPIPAESGRTTATFTAPINYDNR